jgi:hypothetical protein
MEEMKKITLLLCVADSTKIEWPERTAEACHFCIGPIPGVPFPLPVSYDAKRAKYECLGFYCCPNCSEAQRRRMKIGDASWLQLILRDYFHFPSWKKAVTPSAPLEWLAVLIGKHGGDVQAARREYHEHSVCVTCIEPCRYFVRVTYFLEQSCASQQEVARRKRNADSMDVAPVPLAETKRGSLEQRRKKSTSSVQFQSLFAQKAFVDGK